MTLEQDKNFIASAVSLRTVPYTFSKNTTLAVTEEGKKVLKAGTIYPANDATAKGVVLADLVLEDDFGNAKNAVGALIVSGHLYSNRMPVAPESTAVTKLAGTGLFFEEEPSTTVPADGTL